MKIVHLVSVADAQSIPLELAMALKARDASTIVAAFRDAQDHPLVERADDIICLGASGAFDIAAVLRLRALLARQQPEILHLHHAVSAFWAVLVALTLPRRPILVKTEHNDHRAQPWHQRAINLALFPFFRAIVCNSDTTLASFLPLEKRLAGTRGLRIYNGLDLDRVRVQRARRTQHNGPVVIGHVGRLVAQKNQARLIEGLALARAKSGRDLRLEIVGHGPLRPTLEAAARKAGVADAVTFSGAIARDAVYEKLGHWDAFIMPSAFEGFCNALVEAIAADLPVAVSDIDTLREVAGPHALRFDHTDPQAIADALIGLVERPLRDAAFADRYAMANTVAQHLALYRALHAGQAARPQPVASVEGAGP